MRPLSFSIIFLFAFVCSGQLRGDIISRSFTGVITTVNSGGQAGTSIGSVDGISIGSTFTATFSYDTANAGADANAANTSQGVFTITPSVNTLLTVDINGRIFQKTAIANLTAQTFDNVVSTLSNNTDSLSIVAIGPSLPSGWSVANANTVSTRLTFFDAAGLALPTDALPTSFSPNWSIGLFNQSFNTNVTTPSGVITGLYLEGNLNITAVPEPSSACLGMLALSFSAMLFAVKRKRLSQRSGLEHE